MTSDDELIMSQRRTIETLHESIAIKDLIIETLRKELNKQESVVGV